MKFGTDVMPFVTDQYSLCLTACIQLYDREREAETREV
jgi:hypothetical protein